jgi:hypothetical protein
MEEEPYKDEKWGFPINTNFGRPLKPGDIVRSSRDEIYEAQENGSVKKLGYLLHGNFYPHVKLHKKDRKKYRELVSKEVRDEIEKFVVEKNKEKD